MDSEGRNRVSGPHAYRLLSQEPCATSHNSENPNGMRLTTTALPQLQVATNYLLAFRPRQIHELSHSLHHVCPDAFIHDPLSTDNQFDNSAFQPAFRHRQLATRHFDRLPRRATGVPSADLPIRIPKRSIHNGHYTSILSDLSALICPLGYLD